MEYGMCTLITGERSFGSLVGVVAHELAHSWFQFVLATNESKYPWMDEGFATYISQKAEDKVLERFSENPNKASYDSYYKFVTYNISEPMTTHADHYRYNYAYGISSYDKGAIFLKQLAYVIGEEPLEKVLQKYYKDFKFKHPTPHDFLRTAEKISGISLDWYYNNWIETTHEIDYSVTVNGENEIVLDRIGSMHMPLDFVVSYDDGTKAYFYIPIVAMRGEKRTNAELLNDWSWVAPQYRFSVQKKIQSVAIDPLELMADIDKSNNRFPRK
jgi:aminopeptidase N